MNETHEIYQLKWWVNKKNYKYENITMIESFIVNGYKIESTLLQTNTK